MNTLNQLFSKLFLFCLFSIVAFSCSEDLAIENDEEVVIETRAYPGYTGPVDDVGPGDYGYKLTLITGDWEYTGNDLPTGHQIWDCVNEKTRTWVFRTYSECDCMSTQWDNDNPDDAICIYKESCVGGNFKVNQTCDW